MITSALSVGYPARVLVVGLHGNLQRIHGSDDADYLGFLDMSALDRACSIRGFALMCPQSMSGKVPLWTKKSRAELQSLVADHVAACGAEIVIGFGFSAGADALLTEGWYVPRLRVAIAHSSSLRSAPYLRDECAVCCVAGTERALPTDKRTLRLAEAYQQRGHATTVLLQDSAHDRGRGGLLRRHHVDPLVAASALDWARGAIW